MFDLSGLLNSASDMFKGSSFEDVLGDDIASRLSNLDFDPASLDGTQLGDIQSLLEGTGIDLSALSESQVGELITSVKENGGIEGLDLSQVFDQSSN